MTDWVYVRRVGNYRKDRIASLRPDEEPDDDMLSANKRKNRATAVYSEQEGFRRKYQRRMTR